MDELTVDFSRHKTNSDLVLLALTVLLGKPHRTVTITDRIVTTWSAFPGSMHNMAEFTLFTAGIRAGDCCVRAYHPAVQRAAESWQEHLQEKKMKVRS